MGDVIPLKTGTSLEEFLLAPEEPVGHVPEGSKHWLTRKFEALLRRDPTLFPQIVTLSYEVLAALEDPRGIIPFEPVRMAVDLELLRVTRRWSHQVIPTNQRSMASRLVVHLEPELDGRFEHRTIRITEGYTPAPNASVPALETWTHIRKDSPDGTFQLLLDHPDAARVIGDWIRDLGGRTLIQDAGVRKIATTTFGKVRIRQAGDTPAEALLRVWIQRVR